MKKLLLLLFTSFMLCCCDNDDDTPATNPIDLLPPATQIGANTFGCILDGVAFKPDNSTNSINCFYQIVNGEYYFTVSAAHNNANTVATGISLKTEMKEIQEGITYDLVEPNPNKAYGLYSYGFLYYTSEIHTGKLTITKLTSTIVSGTFWFNVIDNNGIVHQIREGRFDMQYTN